MVSWMFKTSEDIDFSVYFQGEGSDEGGAATVLVPEARAPSHEAPQMGEVRVATAGTVVLRFSNEYSFWTAKTLEC